MKPLLLALLLTGCASVPGVEMSEEERKVCAAEKTCTVWSQQDLRSLIQHFFRQGYQSGRNSKGSI